MLKFFRGLRWDVVGVEVKTRKAKFRVGRLNRYTPWEHGRSKNFHSNGFVWKLSG